MNFPFIHHHNHSLKMRRQPLAKASSSHSSSPASVPMLIRPSLALTVFPKPAAERVSRGVTPSPPVSPKEDRRIVANFMPAEPCQTRKEDLPCHTRQDLDFTVKVKQSSCRYCLVTFHRDEDAIQHEDFYCPSNPQSLFGLSSPFDEDLVPSISPSTKRKLNSSQQLINSSSFETLESTTKRAGAFFVEHTPKKLRPNHNSFPSSSSCLKDDSIAGKSRAIRRVSVNEAECYNACLMIQRGTLGVLIKRNVHDEMIFDGYTDEISLNKARKAIRKAGDVFVEIEGESLLGRTFVESKALLIRYCKESGRPFLNVRFQHVPNKSNFERHS